MKRIIYDYENPHIVGKERRSFSIVKLIIIILVVSLAAALIYALLFKDTSQSADAKEYFIVTAGKYDDPSTADAAAQALQARGGGGYIRAQGNIYIVIASVYKNKADALIVAKRYGFEVSGLGRYSAYVDLGDKSLSRSALEMYMYPEVVFDELYSLSLALDKAEIADAAALYALDDIASKIETCMEEIKTTKLLDKQRQNLTELYLEIKKSIKAESKYSVASKIKYSLIEIALLHSDFLVKAK